ncbi:hypothetical protein IKF28_03155 [Candidatus Saccharibacteria bacterium]|nr:hypothetical protein [Candidatus Saccharibacteria bacterium]
MARKKAFSAGDKTDNILQELKLIRKDLNYVSSVMRILELSGYMLKNPISLALAKRFLVEMVRATPITSQTDLKRQIVLMSWSLLDEKKAAWSNKVAIRHQQFVENYGFKGLTGKSSDPADLNHTEDTIYKTIAIYYTKYLTSDRQFFLDVFDGKLPEGIVISSPVPVNNLPLQSSDFIGREKYLDQLHQNFNDDNGNNQTGCKVQILYGMGGVGKSEIAKYYAYRYMGEYKVIVWLDFTDDNTLSISTTEFLMRKNPDQIIQDSSQARHLLLNYLSSLSQFLLILDNVDYLDEDKAREKALNDQLKSYLPNHAGHIIITTRCNAEFLNAARIKVTGFNKAEVMAYLDQTIYQQIEDFADIMVINEMVSTADGLPEALSYFVSIIKERDFIYLEKDAFYNSIGFLDQKTAGRRAISEIFEPTARKLAGDKEVLVGARDILIHYAFLNAKYLPLEEYNKVLKLMKRVKMEIPRPLMVYADSELYGTKLAADAINVLTRYSIIDYDGYCIKMSPLLAGLIVNKTEMDEAEVKRFSFCANKIMALVYTEYGDEELARKYYAYSMAEIVAKEQDGAWFLRLFNPIYKKKHNSR